MFNGRYVDLNVSIVMEAAAVVCMQCSHDTIIFCPAASHAPCAAIVHHVNIISCK